MEVSIISREAIKPSSPTPPHLRTFKVSLLDKSYKTTFISFISYYLIEHPNDEVYIERIKLALAKTLTGYYPMAGRPSDNGSSSIDCNDKGVAFATARVNCRLSDLLKDPKVLPLMPSMCTSDDNDDPAQIGIQLTLFDCGGIALSMNVCHYICDATSVAAFLKCCSEISRFEDRDLDHIPVAYPSFPGAELFTTYDDDGDDVVMSTPYVCLPGEEKCVLQRFVFDEDQIRALREEARREDVLPNPTRVEAVSMFIWKHCMAGAAQVRGARQPSKMDVVAELRRRMAPLLSEKHCGNIFLRATIESRNDDDDDGDISRLIRSFRTAIHEDVIEVIPKLTKNKGVGGGRAALLQYMEKFKQDRKDKSLNKYLMSSWCRLGFTEIDFGWGKPVWFSHIWMDDLPSDCRNIIIIVDGQGGQKIEAWILLDAREMNVLENNQDFLAYASLNPQILI